MWEIEGVRALCEVVDCYSRRTSPAGLSSRAPMKRLHAVEDVQVHRDQGPHSVQLRLAATFKARVIGAQIPRCADTGEVALRGRDAAGTFQHRRWCPQSCQHKLSITNNLRSRLSVGRRGGWWGMSHTR